MRIITDQHLWCFQFWSGAVDIKNQLTPNELDIIEEELEELYPDGLDEVELNDLFWFQPEVVVEDILGFKLIDGIVIREQPTDD